jgi:hypothetical protein
LDGIHWCPANNTKPSYDGSLGCNALAGFLFFKGGVKKASSKSLDFADAFFV